MHNLTPTDMDPSVESVERTEGGRVEWIDREKTVRKRSYTQGKKHLVVWLYFLCLIALRRPCLKIYLNDMYSFILYLFKPMCVVVCYRSAAVHRLHVCASGLFRSGMWSQLTFHRTHAASCPSWYTQPQSFLQ